MDFQCDGGGYARIGKPKAKKGNENKRKFFYALDQREGEYA